MIIFMNSKLKTQNSKLDFPMDLLIFDFDGLILDTETVSYQAWNEIYRHHGATLPLDKWALCIGTHQDSFNVYEYLEESSGKALDHDDLRKAHHARVLELLGPMEPRPGVVDYLEEARRLKIVLALASSSPQDWVVGHLSRLGLAELFHSIRCADDVANVKPDPELYQLTLTFTGVKPERALAFEDSPNGIQAAKNAGVFCVAVPNSVTRQLPIGHADYRLESMADLTLRELLHKIETQRSVRS
jgi:HAD superfamily hydrolase (TIGR01509 family)